jgi:uncharacterized repeat protein (TIGR01451 family)
MNTRFFMKTLWVAGLCASSAIASGALAAEKAGCVELKSEAQSAQSYTNEQGQKATRLVPAGKIVPGDEVTWTITARNVCDKSADNIVVANPVPEHMTYVANSATGPGTDITFSIDGREFKKAEELTVHDASGSTRVAHPDEYRFVRWTFKAAFDKGAVAFVRYRATVN